MLFLTLIYLALYFEKSISIELLRTFNFVTFSLGLTSTTLILPPLPQYANYTLTNSNIVYL